MRMHDLQGYIETNPTSNLLFLHDYQWVVTNQLILTHKLLHRLEPSKVSETNS